MQPRNLAEVKRLNIVCRKLKDRIIAELGKENPSDAKIARIALTLLDQGVGLARAKGNFFDDEDGDNVQYVRAEKVVELLRLIPQIPEGADPGIEKGFPKTRGLFWFTLAGATIAGTREDARFVPHLLKKYRLSHKEEEALKTNVTKGFSTLCFETRFWTNLRHVRRGSEGLVVKIMLRFAAGALDAEYICEWIVRRY